MEGFCAFLHQGCERMGLCRTSLHCMLNVYVDSIQELSLGQVHLLCDIGCSVARIHNIGQEHVTL